MKEELIFNTDLHFEHETWMRELDFWNDEIESFQNRLNELVMRFTDKDMLSSVEKFQNQLNIHEEVMNSIRNQIQTTAFEEGFDAKPFEESINGTLETTREIIDRGRDRQSAQPLWWFGIALFSIVALSFVVTLLHSWRADVARLLPSPEDSTDAET